MVVLVTTAGGVEKVELILHLSKDHIVIACDAEETPITDMYQNIPNVSFVKTPGFRDEVYLDFMDELCKSEDVDYYMSIDTFECIELSNKAHTLPYIKGVKGSWAESLIESVHLNKSSVYHCLYSHLKKNNKEFPLVWMDKYTYGISKNQLDTEAIEEAFGNIVEAGYTKVVFKPDDSNGSRGLRVVDLNYLERDLAQSRSPYFVPITYLEIFPTWTENIIVQPYYEGVNYNIDCYKDSTGTIHVVGQKVLGNRWGQVLGSEFITEQDEEYDTINQWAAFISAALRLNKNFNFELSYDAVASKLKLVEVNPRISAVIAQTIGSEVDLPKIMLQDAQGPIEPVKALSKLTNKSYLLTAKS